MMQHPDHRILVVDDDVGICELVADVAEGLGFTVRHRQTPDDIWADIEEYDPDVLLLDLDLPHVDGVRLLGMLGEEEARQDILLMSGLDSRTLATAQRIGRDHGLRMAGALNKPFPVSQLESLLSGLLPVEGPAVEGELLAGLEVGEVVVHYQPKVALDNDGAWMLHSAEALVRWQHPRLGFIHPDSFIPLAEETGLVLPLTRYVLEDALSRVCDWRAAGIDISVAVNLSPLLLGRSSLPDEFADRVKAWGLEPRNLILEVTESAAMQDVSRSTEVLTRFRVKGFGLSLDDFGTGYSSLVHLYRLPFNEIKVDKSFVFEIGQNPESETVVKSVIGLGHSLGLKVCAEGVETHATMRHLAALGCDYFQGYFIARPEAPEAILEMFGADD